MLNGRGEGMIELPLDNEGAQLGQPFCWNVDEIMVCIGVLSDKGFILGPSSRWKRCVWRGVDVLNERDLGC